MELDDRVRRYLEKMPDAISGQNGHNTAFSVAMVLVEGFGLDATDARRHLKWFSDTKSQPAWTEKEIEHKLESALNKVGKDKGYLLRDDQKRDPPPNGSKQNREKAECGFSMDLPQGKIEGPQEDAGLALLEFLENVIAGKIRDVAWPWFMLGKLTQANIPGASTILTSPPGSGKSFFLMSSFLHWINQGEKTAMLCVEDPHQYHVRRAFAISAKNANLLDLKWMETHPEPTREAGMAHQEFLGKIANSIQICNGPATTDLILDWIREKIKTGFRMILIDSCSMKINLFKVWDDDLRFMVKLEELMKKADASVVLSWHPPKNSQGDANYGSTGGGVALQKATRTILSIEFLKGIKDLEVCTHDGERVIRPVNRKVHLVKTRNGKGQGMTLGFLFDPMTLVWTEQGFIVPKS